MPGKKRKREKSVNEDPLPSRPAGRHLKKRKEPTACLTISYPSHFSVTINKGGDCCRGVPSHYNFYYFHFFTANTRKGERELKGEGRERGRQLYLPSTFHPHCHKKGGGLPKKGKEKKKGRVHHHSLFALHLQPLLAAKKKEGGEGGGALPVLVSEKVERIMEEEDGTGSVQLYDSNHRPRGGKYCTS